MVGPNWPNSGEIDIYEGVHLNTYNQMTLHSSPGCVPVYNQNGGQTGTHVSEADCGAGGGFNGCGVQSNSATSYGTSFNARGGGVYATLWTSSGIKIWYFPSDSVPGNIRSGNPDPNSWGTPQANFAGCNFDAKFSNMNIVSCLGHSGVMQGTDIRLHRSSILHSAVTGPVAFGAQHLAPASTQAVMLMSRSSHSHSPTRTGSLIPSRCTPSRPARQVMDTLGIPSVLVFSLFYRPLTSLLVHTLCLYILYIFTESTRLVHDSRL
jgi:hypothetical protein